MTREDFTSVASQHAVFGRRFIRHLSALVRIYWTSPDARQGMLLLAGTVMLELATVYGNFRLADGQRRMIDALQEGEPTPFLAAIGFFARRGRVSNGSYHGRKGLQPPCARFRSVARYARHEPSVCDRVRAIGRVRDRQRYLLSGFMGRAAVAGERPAARA
jgi:hypothetical protein